MIAAAAAAVLQLTLRVVLSRRNLIARWKRYDPCKHKKACIERTPIVADEIKRIDYYYVTVPDKLVNLISTLLVSVRINLTVNALYWGNVWPACSATMYAEYQSGHLASRCPRRFSCSP